MYKHLKGQKEDYYRPYGYGYSYGYTNLFYELYWSQKILNNSDQNT